MTGRADGRHRFFSLASTDVAHAIETLATIARPARIVALTQSMQFERLRAARSCYDHLAGRLGVALADWLVRNKAIESSGADFKLGHDAQSVFRDLRIDLDAARTQRRAFVRACVDWTERRPHLAGSVGAALLTCFLDRGWIARNVDDRAVAITAAGRRALERRFEIDTASFTRT
ncbi:MAG TPA: hypothetical protein VIK27_02105 [Candidatus Aquilonibacter sp.]